tara:strand:- start:3838 stop:5061 length:1224 start_codon:yes stop_codon:yes gene_type:complete
MIQAIKAKFIVTPGQAPIRDSAVIIKNNIIEKIIPSTELKNNYYKIIDLKNSVMLPGFINSHIHLELHWVQKLLEPFKSFPSWLNQIIKLKKNFNNSKIPYWVNKSLNECINSGVTTIGEISSYDGLDYKPILDKKIRAVYFYELTNSTLKNIENKFFQSLIRNKPNPLINFRIFPHSIYSLDTKSLKGILAFAKKHNIKLGMHLSESIDEVKYSKRKKNNLEDEVFSQTSHKPTIETKPTTPLEYLDTLNRNRQDITLIHMNNLSQNDFKILMKKEYPVIICPRSNLYLNQKLPNIKFFMNYMKTGLGTDGLSSNLSINFLDEINFLYLNAKKIINKAEEKILSIATIGGAKALGIDNEVGTIEIGKKADIIAFDLINKNPYLSIIHSKKRNLKMSMINGKIIKLR